MSIMNGSQARTKRQSSSAETMMATETPRALVAKTTSQRQRTLISFVLASLAVAAILAILSTGTTSEVSASSIGHGSSQKASDTYDNLDNIISEYLEDRLKKSKQNSVHPIKQTLRFGRRSDPSMLTMPASFFEQDEGANLLGQQQQQQQRHRLLSIEED